MARIQGTAKLSSTLEPRMGAPLDARERVFLKSDLTAEGSFPYPWIGMEVYCVEDGKKYRLVSDNPTVLGNWEEVGGESGAVKVVSSFPENPSNEDVVAYTGNDYNEFNPVEGLTPLSNPQELGLYEYSSDEYVLSTDEQADVQAFAYSDGSLVVYILSTPSVGSMAYEISPSGNAEAGLVTEYDEDNGIKIEGSDEYFARYSGEDKSGKNYFEYLNYTKGIYEYTNNAWRPLGASSIPVSYIESLF